MPILELKSVSKSYGAGDARTEVLKNVSLSVTEGEFVDKGQPLEIIRHEGSRIVGEEAQLGASKA